MPSPLLPVADERAHLRADCSRCAALCCVAPAFAASADFAIDKPAGHAVPEPAGRRPCGIHDRLRERGFPGCAVFDCFGAGQHVTQVTFGGRTWRESPELAGAMFAVLPVMRQLHEMLWYLTEARPCPRGGAAARRDRRGPDADRAGSPTAARTSWRASTSRPSRREVGDLLERVSALVARPERRRTAAART